MLELGPALRGLMEGAAAAYIAKDSVDAAILYKRIGPGLRLSDLVSTDQREEIDSLIAAIRARAEAGFLQWKDKFGTPDHEVRRAFDAYEICAARELPAVLKALTPGDDPVTMLEGVIAAAAARDPKFHNDIVARDICWAMVKSAVAAAGVYSGALSSLKLQTYR